MIEEFSGKFIKIKNFCQDNNLIQDSDLVIIGLSGGIDSVFLFYFLLWLQQRKFVEFDLIAAHLNHQIRKEADQDQAFVEQLCQKYSIPLISKNVDIPGLAKQRKSGEEEAGRYARQQFFSELIADYRSKPDYLDSKIKVALGHHQDDLAESVVLNIGRGTGLSGLSTLKASENFYIRPLLDTSKAQIMNLAQMQAWEWVEDQTNTSEQYLRNRIRHQLLPLWNEIVGYNINPLIARLANNLNQDELALIWAGEEAYKSCLLDKNQLSLGKLRRLPQSIFKFVIDQWLQTRNQTKILSFAQTEQLWKIVQGEHGNKLLDLGEGIIVKRYRQRLIFVE
ncbi:MAG: tRNA lysidine(34) synthetase TilS [Clostridiaceae bacterium]|jgi:tRNA(Ile)-lysidine synthase|nr:tRNA lysidine(34) synthetase TilS [Clostridiaceae bacterium]